MTARSRLSPERVLVGAVVAGALSVLVLMGREGFLVPNVAVLAVLTVSLLVGELYPVEIRRGNGRMLLMLSTTFMFALVLYAGPATAALVTALVSLVADRLEKMPWDRVLFNAGQYALTVAAVGAVLAGLGHEPGTLAAGPIDAWHLATLIPAGVTLAITNHLLVSAAIALSTGNRFWDELTEDVGPFALSSGLMLSFAPIVLVVATWSVVLVPALLALAFAVHRGTKESLQREFEAQHDRLTGLPNRSLLPQRLADGLEHAGPSHWPAVLQINLNRFRDVNETLGHEAGDDLLCLVARRLEETIEEGASVFRLAADEFTIVASVPEPVSAAGLADTVLDGLRTEFVVRDFRLHVRPSIGVAVYPEHGQDVDTLLRHADVALRSAQERHRTVEIYRSDRDEQSHRRLRLVSDLQRAIADRQLFLHFQPQADLHTGEVVAAEALVRWDHPRYGPVSPGEFVPLAERSGLIIPMTELVLDSALAHASQWTRAGFSLRVSVNVSMQDLIEADLPAMTTRLLTLHGVDPQQLELEVTESSIMAEPDEAIGVLSTLRSLGIGVAMDDFGTGYSSLSYLQRLPLETLKIDRSFVQRLGDDGGAAIVRTTVQLGNSLGVRVVAEGAESEQDWQMLADLGCTLVQGYYLARPMSASDLMVWLLSHEQSSDGPARVARVSPPLRVAGHSVRPFRARPAVP